MLRDTAKQYRTRSWETTECYGTLQNSTGLGVGRLQNVTGHCKTVHDTTGLGIRTVTDIVSS